jgi:hypothetical protein
VADDQHLILAIQISDQALDELVEWDPSDRMGFIRRATEAIVMINQLKAAGKKEKSL